MISTSPFQQPQSQQHQEHHDEPQEFQTRDAFRGSHPSLNPSITQRSTVASVASPTISILSAAPAGYDDATELQEWDYAKPPHNPSNDSNCCETPRSEQASGSTECGYSGPTTTPDDSGSDSSDCSRGASPPPPNGPVASIRKKLKLHSRFAAFWNNHMSVVVPFNAARDHLALERTYLAYHRTSLVFAIFAAITAQLTVIQHAPTPSTTFGIYRIGKPISIVLVCFSLVISVLGVLRWWRLQSGLLRGIAISGGLEVWGLAGGFFSLTLVLFGLALAVDIEKEY
ncbi:hypothetical protein L873DRAFT_431183 [Choiromyces venosus 120613-1]|uniref:DUF202 domain-containing protein n=1 Tax=Choiromyces venosus 120613-1 TaxID=1336337 RepID=A0A3N4IXE3_9PEZI|nr:hypothetical protein L873DRAFT_431183 [Choiromyces venosus 120613-1]